MDYPQRIGLSIYPGVAVLQSVGLMLRENGWSSIAALIDFESYPRETLHRGLHDQFNGAFNGKNPNYLGITYVTYSYNRAAGDQEVAESLKKVSEISRGRTPSL